MDKPFSSWSCTSKSQFIAGCGTPWDPHFSGSQPYWAAWGNHLSLLVGGLWGFRKLQLCTCLKNFEDRYDTHYDDVSYKRIHKFCLHAFLVYAFVNVVFFFGGFIEIWRASPLTTRWRFPRMEVPPNHLNLNGIFHYKSSKWDSPIYGKPFNNPLIIINHILTIY